MSADHFQAVPEKNADILAALSPDRIYGARIDLRKNGSSFVGLCPFHSEKTPSFTVFRDLGYKCFGCGRHGSAFDFVMETMGLDFQAARRHLATAAGVLLDDAKTKNAGNPAPWVTVEELASNKKLPAEFLRSLGLTDIDRKKVKIPYFLSDGTPAPRQRIRTALSAKDGSRWDNNDGPLVPYGLEGLIEARKAEFLVMAEGESDPWTLWYHGFPCLGIPGATNTRCLQAEHVAGFKKIFIIQEPDSGGKAFVTGLAKRLAQIGFEGEARVVSLGSHKDPNDLHRSNPELFPENFRILLDAAEPLKLDAEDVKVRVEETEWPDPSRLGDELPPVLAFTPELLPKSFLPLVEDISERMQTPMDYAAAAAIVALASCVNRRATMQPKAEDTSWLVIPNLWGAIIAPPGTMKSPILRAVTLPLTRIEESWRAEYESALEGFELEKECVDLRYQSWKEDYKRAVKKGEAPPVQPDKSLPEPTQRRLTLTDATFEKLHEILKENPSGVLVLRDELTGWLATLDKQGREGERAFYLQAWNGDASFTVDRIGRGSIYVPAVCVSLLGAIQPARLRWYLSDTVTGGQNDDGLFQRFQILVWPDQPREWRLIDRPPNNHALALAEKAFSVLAHLSADSPVRMRFDCDGQKLFFEWLTELERKVRGDCGLHPAMVAHLAKYRSLMPSLAALFELADRAATGKVLEGEITVTIEHTKQAAAFCEYLESHARRVYSCVVSPQSRAARELARHLQAGDLSSPFKTRDVYLKGWSGLDEAGCVRNALELLEDAAWIRREEAPIAQSGGRPSEMWRISPNVVSNEK